MVICIVSVVGGTSLRHKRIHLGNLCNSFSRNDDGRTGTNCQNCPFQSAFLITDETNNYVWFNVVVVVFYRLWDQSVYLRSDDIPRDSLSKRWCWKAVGKLPERSLHNSWNQSWYWTGKFGDFRKWSSYSR